MYVRNVKPKAKLTGWRLAWRHVCEFTHRFVWNRPGWARHYVGEYEGVGRTSKAYGAGCGAPREPGEVLPLIGQTTRPPGTTLYFDRQANRRGPRNVNRKKRRTATNNLVALGSAAVLAVYAAGYDRTRSAAQRFAAETAERRPAVPTAGIGAVQPASAPPVIESSAGTGAVPTNADPAASSKPKQASTSGTEPAKSPPVSTAAATPDSTTVPAVAKPAADSTGRTSQAADSTAPAAAIPQVVYKDGTYTGWGTSRHGDIRAAVEIKDGRIISATITECLTRYSCSWIAELPPQVLARQSPETDYVSGATQSTNAFYYAVVQALSKAK